MAKNLDLYYPKPCANCGHRNLHGDISGCIANKAESGQRPDWCDCTTYVEPGPTKVARTIPSRNTDPGTSHAATTAITVKANTQRARLLVAFSALADATDEEAMEKAEGVSPMSEFAKRCSELRDGGLIETTGEARTGSSGVPRIVSRITDAGRAVVAGLE